MVRKVSVLAAALAICAFCGTAFAASLGTPVDLSSVTEVPAQRDSNQQRLHGYFKSDVVLSGDVGREVRYYVPDTAVIRPYFHYIAVDSKTDVSKFLEDSGWINVADETGECLMVFLPAGEGEWGTPASEDAYIRAARAIPGTQGSGPAADGKYFSAMGMYYLTGYGAGVSGLQVWAAANPNLVIGQTYIGGEQNVASIVAEKGAEFWSYKHMTDGDIRDRDTKEENPRQKRTEADGSQKILRQMTARLKSSVNSDAGENAGLLRKSDMPVPTWFINRQFDDEVEVWRKYNRAYNPVVPNGSFGNYKTIEYAQSKATMTTEFAGNISKVSTFETPDGADPLSPAFTRLVRDEMAVFSRYDATIAYGNALTYRVDYTPIQVERYKNGSSAKGTVTVRNHPTSSRADEVKTETAEMEIEKLNLVEGEAFRGEMLTYVPTSIKGNADIPVVIVWHGGSQTGNLFFDCTNWWQVANEEGFALVFVTRTTHGGGTPQTYDLDVFEAVWASLKKKSYNFDFSRVYSTGQSMGGIASFTMGKRRPERFAAVYSTNAIADGATNDEGIGNNIHASIPMGLFIGEANYVLRGIPGYKADTSWPEDETECLVRSEQAAKDGADIYWDRRNMNFWEDFIKRGNEEFGGMKLALRSDANGKPVVKYSNANPDIYGGTNKDDAPLSEWQSNNARFRTFYWDNENKQPVMAYTFSLYQAHNCLPGYRRLIWDFLKHFRVDYDEETGILTRSYSASANAAANDWLILGTAAEYDADTSIDVTDPVEPSPDTPAGKRSSSGGCDAGLGGLAVLALAAFALSGKR